MLGGLAAGICVHDRVCVLPFWMVNYMAQQFEVCVKVWVCVRACGCIFAGKVITKQAWGIAGLLGCCTGCCCTSTALASGSCVPPGVLAAH